MSFSVPKKNINIIVSKYWKSPQEVFWFIPGPKQVSPGTHRRCLSSSGLPRMDPQHSQVPGVSPAFCLEVLYSNKDLFSMWRPIIGRYQLIHKPRKSVSSGLHPGLDEQALDPPVGLRLQALIQTWTLELIPLFMHQGSRWTPTHFKAN